LYIADLYGFSTMFMVFIFLSVSVALGFWRLKKQMEKPLRELRFESLQLRVDSLQLTVYS